MENYAHDLYLMEQRQRELAKLAENAWQLEDVRSTQPRLLDRLNGWASLLGRVSKIRIEVSVVVNEPRLDNARC